MELYETCATKTVPFFHMANPHNPSWSTWDLSLVHSMEDVVFVFPSIHQGPHWASETLWEILNLGQWWLGPPVAACSHPPVNQEIPSKDAEVLESQLQGPRLRRLKQLPHALK